MAQFALGPEETSQTILNDVFLGNEATWLPRVTALTRVRSPTDVNAARRFERMTLPPTDIAALTLLEDVLLTGADAKAPFTAKTGTFPTKATRAALGPLREPLIALMHRTEATRPKRIAFAAAERSHALHRFAAPFLTEYAARKAARGLLDFDDLITRAQALLTDTSVAQWVLFRLDGGLDHILVDEAQDTSPDQWRVIELMAQEFSAGQSGGGACRTIFVVGDKKQSIYSFQGPTF